EVDEARFGSAIGHQPCLAMAGDDFAEVHGRPDLVKIDVAGAEAKVLAGRSRTLQRVRSLIIEVEGDLAASFEQDYAPLLNAAGLIECPIAAPSSGRNRIFSRPGA